jgi:hypothetical protein
VQQDSNPLPHELARHEPRTRHFSPSAFPCFGSCPFALAKFPPQYGAFSLTSNVAQSLYCLGYASSERGIGVRFPAGKSFSLLHSVKIGPGAHPSFCIIGAGAPYPGSKATGASNSPCAAEFNNARSYTSIFLYISKVLSLIKHTNNFTFSIGKSPVP